MKSNVLVLISLGCLANLVSAHPTPKPLRSLIRPRQSRNSQQQTARQQQQGLPGIGEGPAEAPDGTPILEDEVVINGLPIRFKISAPSGSLVAGNGNAAGNGAAATQGNAAAKGSKNARQAAADLGINVLFHGDGGQSFFDFPNAGVNNNLMGVALLSPDPQLRWGGFDAQDQTGLVRPDGEEHSAAVNSFLTETLPTLVNFDKIFMEGVSGGSLMLSGFTIPEFGASLGVPGVVFGCGGVVPQVAVKGDISNIRVHWQSSQDDLAPLQTSIPDAITAYEKEVRDAGLSDAEINTLHTADNSPAGGHCEFDGKDFVTGVQSLTDVYSDIIAGNAELNGVVVTNGVVGNENLFAGAANAAGGAGAGNGAANNAATAQQAGNAKQTNKKASSVAAQIAALQQSQQQRRK